MKKLISFLLSFLFFPVLTSLVSPDVSAYIESDGKVNLYEWEKCDRTILFQGYDVSGSCYHSICVRYKYIELDRRIYVAVTAENGNSDLSKTPENNYTELYLSFNESSRITVCSDGKSKYDEDEFYIKYGSINDSFGGVAYEVETILKETGFNETLTMYLQMKDYENNLTQIFEIEIKSEELKEKESESIAESEKQSEKESKANAKTTKDRTTKGRTTKKKTTTEKETTTELKTALITEEYVPYSEELRKSNRGIIAIGAACVLTSVAAMCVSVFKKDKKE